MNGERIALLTDSTCDLPPALLEEKGITLVPLTVSFDDQEYLDNLELASDEFYARLAASAQLPTTSQPPLGLFLETFESLQSRGFTHVLGLFLTRKFSGTFQGAQVAAKMAKGLTIEVLDSQSASWGHGLLLLHAQELMAAGLTFAQVVERIRQRRDHTTVLFSLDTLDALQRGGRIGKAAAFLGKAFGIRPILSLPGASGEIEIIGKVNSRPGTIKALVAQAQRHVREHGLAYGLAVMHSVRPDMAGQLLEALRGSGDDWKAVHTGRIGAVIGTHLGPDGWAVALC
jgi:DegV family protein with EDD domain